MCVRISFNCGHMTCHMTTGDGMLGKVQDVGKLLSRLSSRLTSVTVWRQNAQAVSYLVRSAGI